MINLTQHVATSAQLEAGVVEPVNKETIKELLTFDELPSKQDIVARAFMIALVAKGHESALIGGAPYFMPHLSKALKDMGVTPYYAFSKRQVEEIDGVKKSVFKHIGFIEA